jgi:hypothetical protein
VNQVVLFERSLEIANKSDRIDALMRLLGICVDRVADSERAGWPALAESWRESERRVRFYIGERQRRPRLVA